jgi:hypothetical protein
MRRAGSTQKSHINPSIDRNSDGAVGGGPARGFKKGCPTQKIFFFCVVKRRGGRRPTRGLSLSLSNRLMHHGNSVETDECHILQRKGCKGHSSIGSLTTTGQQLTVSWLSQLCGPILRHLGGHEVSTVHDFSLQDTHNTGRHAQYRQPNTSSCHASRNQGKQYASFHNNNSMSPTLCSRLYPEFATHSCYLH